MKPTFFKKLTIAAMSLVAVVVVNVPSIVPALAQGVRPGTDDCPAGSFCLPNPLKFDNIWELLQGMSTLAVRFGTIVAVLAFIYAGYLYVAAVGNETKLKKAHETLKYVAIGTAIILSSTIVVNLVVETLSRINNG